MENKETFQARLKPWFAPSDQLQIKLAYCLAKFGHRAQTRNEMVEGKPTRYFEHVRRVALVLMDDVKIMDRDMIIACLLHDSVEDTDDISIELIEHTFGTNVAHMVALLSKAPKEGYKERLKNCHEWKVLLLKFCDRLDNCRSLMVPGNTIEFQKKQVQETIEEYLPLFEYMQELVPDIYKPQVAKLVKELDRMVHAYAVRLLLMQEG
jgi:(p)ppGpp synthase/HD superfamily hydrolase